MDDLEELRREIETDPENPELLIRYLRYLSRHGKSEEAFSIIDEGIRQNDPRILGDLPEFVSNVGLNFQDFLKSTHNSLIGIESENFWVRQIEQYNDSDGRILTVLDLDGSERRYYIFPSQEIAGDEAVAYYEDMFENRPTEFEYQVTSEVLDAWDRGEWAGPGLNSYAGPEQWIESFRDEPESHWGNYNHTEERIDYISVPLMGMLPATPDNTYDEAVVYRVN